MDRKLPLRTALLCEPSREAFLREKIPFQANSAFECFEVSSIDSPEKLAEKNFPTGSTLFIDAELIFQNTISFEANWNKWNVVLLNHGKDLSSSNWKKYFSIIELDQLDSLSLPRALELAQCQERFPGVFILAEIGTEVFFEKVQTLREVGGKMDRFIAMLEQRHGNLSSQFFNLRQLSYAVLHQALVSAQETSKTLPVVDFQVAADGKRLTFAARFNAPDGVLASWKESMAKNTSSTWHNAQLYSDLLVFTELQNIHQVEVKSMISQQKDFLSTKTCSTLFKSVQDFTPDADSLERQKLAKLLSLEAIPAAIKQTESEEKKEKIDNGATEELRGNELNFKMKADMLLNEKVNLQGLVKKKSQLISTLTKDVNRAQQEILAAQKNATKEILKMRMETEKAKNAARDATKKLVIFQRKMAEKEVETQSAVASQEPSRDFEKELKQAEHQKNIAEEKANELKIKFAKLEDVLARQRKENGELAAEINLLKAKNQKLESSSESTKQGVNSGASEGGSNGDYLVDKLKEAKKAQGESKAKEQELDKEVKRLTLKLETLEKTSKAKAAAAQKQVETAEKGLEEAKKQKSEAGTKVEELRAELKKKVEENNSSERILKKKADDLAESLRLKNLELEKLTKQIAEFRAQLDDPGKKAA